MKKTIVWLGYCLIGVNLMAAGNNSMATQGIESKIASAGGQLDADYSKYGQFNSRVASDYSVLSNAYFKAGKFDEAIEYALHALKVEMKLRKENDPKLAKLYFDTGNKYYMHKEHPTALLYMQKAAEIYKNIGQQESKELGDTYEAIASIYINLEDFEKSKSNLETCLAIRKKVLSPDDAVVKRTEDNLKFVEQEIAKQKGH